MPVRSTLINTSLIPILGTSMSSSQSPCSRLLFTNAFTYTTIAVGMRLLLFAATTGYQIREFADAARRLGIDVTLATDRCVQMDDPWGDGALAVKFDHRMAESLEGLRGMRFDGVAAVGDGPAEAAAVAAEMLGVPFHPPAAARACRDKFLARQLYEAAGMRTPRFFRAALT